MEPSLVRSPAPKPARRTRLPLTTPAALCVTTALLLLSGCAGGPQANAPQSESKSQAQAFTSPDEALRAFTTALRDADTARLLAIMGQGSEDIISSGDEVADRQRAQKFLTLYDQKHALTDDGADRKTLVIGNAEWPFPVPIVRQGKSWRFDAQAGREEILNRRIGENELSAIQVCRAIADAQRDYAVRDAEGDGLQEYARKFISDPGKRNGLYWPTAPGEPPSPLGELVAEAAAEGYRPSQTGPTPYHGYYYRMLEAQGPHAPYGPVEYVVDDNMTLGFAVVAWPADYGNSGIMTFIMGPDGVVFQKNLGDDTAKLAAEMKTFDPGEGWNKVEPSPRDSLTASEEPQSK